MENTRTQNEVNSDEWHNPANWSGTWLCKAYFSKRDSRIFVPRFYKFPLAPATLNYGHRFGPLTHALMLLFILAIWISGMISLQR